MKKKILIIRRVLNIHKVHNHGDISVRLIKICDRSLRKPIVLLLENSTKLSCYPDIGNDFILYQHIKIVTNN